MPYDIITIGSATVDQFADTDSELIKIETATSREQLIAFPLGSKLLIKELNISIGGGGTNSAAAFSRLGFRTAYLGKIGDDVNGDYVIRSLAKEKIEFIGPRNGTTGLSIILNSIAHDRTILAYKGANNDLQPGEIPSTIDSEWIYLSSMLGTSLDTVISALSQCQQHIAFNPSNYQAEMGAQALMPLLERVEILVMNYEEACKFLGLDYRTHPAIDTLFTTMEKLPPRLFVITDGAEGLHAYDGEIYYHAHPAEGLEIVETTGAGDAFASTFTAACMWDEPMKTAIHLGMTNAESVLTQRGAKEKLLDRAALYEKAKTTTRHIEQRALLPQT